MDQPARNPALERLGTFSDDGDTIHGSWEKSSDGSTWEHDFDLTYTKARRQS